MVDRKKLVAIGSQDMREENLAPAAPEPAPELAPEPATDGEAAAADEPAHYDEWDAEEPPVRPSRIVPALACLAVLGWSLFFAWAHQRTILAGASPAEWSQLITDWAVPVLLVVALWLLAMRSSLREAARFNDA